MEMLRVMCGTSSFSVITGEFEGSYMGGYVLYDVSYSRVHVDCAHMRRRNRYYCMRAP